MDIRKNARGWAIVAVSFLILMFIFATCISCMGVYVKPVSEDLGIPRTSFTLTITIQAFAMMLSSMLAGKMLETYNMKRLMMAGTTASAVCMFIFSVAPSITYFYLAGILMGVSVAFTCNIPISILIKNWFDEKKEGFALGIAFVGSGAGAMVLNPLYTFIINSYGWRASYFTAGAFMLVVLIPLIGFIVVKSPEELKYTNGTKTFTSEENPAKQIREDDFTLSDALKQPQTWAVYIGYTILTLASMALLNHGIPFMTDYGMPSSVAAAVISISSAALILGKVISGALYDKYGVRRVTIFEMIVVTLCITGFWINGMIDSMAMIVLFVVLYGIGIPVATLSMPLILPIMYGKSNFGSIMGMFSTASGLGGMLQVIISLIYDSTGSYYPAWIILSVLCLLNVVIFAAFAKSLRKHAI
ncbi:MFS transporter [Eubacteriales bacterium DFI.9.88]|nr:MFS transporter [Eubacteriales bacterium DFI.9.88]